MDQLQEILAYVQKCLRYRMPSLKAWWPDGSQEECNARMSRLVFSGLASIIVASDSWGACTGCSGKQRSLVAAWAVPAGFGRL